MIRAWTTDMPLRFAESDSGSIPVFFVSSATWKAVRTDLPVAAQRYGDSVGFEPSAGRHLIAPAGDGTIAAVVFGIEDEAAGWRDPFLPGKLATLLPGGTYRFANSPHDKALAALSWLLSAYRFTTYKKQDAGVALLWPPDGVDRKRIERIADGVALGRDLINVPANDLGPDGLEAAATALGRQHRAVVKVVRGDMLVKRNFPLVHAVGRASAQKPRIVELAWGSKKAARVTLVGKGVCFDTGGLDIKPDSAMLLMKKDMGGAATALALAHMIMDAGLHLRLRVILAVVENAIAGNAFRPGDIYPSRKGLSVEIGNTDAEGRLILADALTYACEQRPALVFDFATLTGAARAALGPDLPPFYSDDPEIAAAIARHARTAHDPVWQMPLWTPYDAWLDGKISNLCNVTGGPFAGSITAALFLRRFVEPHVIWTHFDVYGWNPKAMPGRPEGGEVQAARLLYSLLEERYGE